jgi:hypothetical protein
MSAIPDLKLRLDAQLERGFEAVATRSGNTLVFNGRKAGCVATPISRENIHEIVGYMPKRWADVELTRTAFKKLGCNNENYVALDGEVLRIRKHTDDVADPFVHLVLHSTPNQPAVSSQESGTVTLAINQVEVPLIFRVVDPAKDYVFTTLYIENAIDAQPLDLEITPGARTATGRTLHLNGNPDTANYVLRWRITT